MSLHAATALSSGAIRGPGRVSMPADMGIRDNRISRRLFPQNKARDLSVLGEDAIRYVRNIMTASQSLTETLSELYRGNAFSEENIVATDFFSQNEDSVPEVTVSLTTETSQFFFASEIVQRIVSNFNTFHGEATRYSGDPKAKTLAQRLEFIARIHAERLADIGLDITEHGALSVDEERLEVAAESGRVEEFFMEEQGRAYGFTSQLERLAYNVTTHTYNYVSRDTRGDNLTENFSYTPPGVTLQYTAFNVGLLFDVTF